MVLVLRSFPYLSKAAGDVYGRRALFDVPLHLFYLRIHDTSQRSHNNMGQTELFRFFFLNRDTPRNFTHV